MVSDELMGTLTAATAAAARHAGHLHSLAGSQATEADRVTDVTGEELAVLRTPNGSVLIYGNQGTAIGFDPEQFAAFREVLERAAMPGQPPAYDGELPF